MAKGPKFCGKLTLQNCCSFFKETVQRDPKVAKKLPLTLPLKILSKTIQRIINNYGGYSVYKLIFS
jgi:hypothetical protein